MSFVDSSGALLCVLLYIFLSFVSITLSPSEETKPQSQFSSPSVRIIDSSDSKDAMASEDVERVCIALYFVHNHVVLLLQSHVS